MDTESPTDFNVTVEIAGGNAIAQLRLMARHEPDEDEPCLSSVLCQDCINDQDCVQSSMNDFVDDPMTHRNLTVFQTELQYQCPLGREFDVHGDGSFIWPTYNITCNWNQTWTPSNVLPNCVCKDMTYRMKHSNYLIPF